MRKARMDRQRALEVETYHRAFDAIDTDRSGTVDPTEVLRML